MVAKKLQGQVALITGASRGIGMAAAERIASAGASVVLIARDEVAVEDAAAHLRQQGFQAIGVSADIADPEQIESVIETTLNQYRRIDILINNAGTIWPVEEIIEVDQDEWAYNIHVNLIGPFYMASTVLPLMLAQGYGRIVNIEDHAVDEPVAGISAYGVAKSGLSALTQCLALELAGKPVIVSGFDPGAVDTNLQADIRSIDTDESGLDLSRFHVAHEHGQLANPDDSARCILWLAGPWNRQSGVSFNGLDADFVSQVRADIPA